MFPEGIPWAIYGFPLLALFTAIYQFLAAMRKLGRPVRRLAFWRRLQEPDAADLAAVHIVATYQLERSEYISASLLPNRGGRAIGAVMMLSSAIAGYVEAYRVSDAEPRCVLLVLTSIVFPMAINAVFGLRIQFGRLWEDTPQRVRPCGSPSAPTGSRG